MRLPGIGWLSKQRDNKYMLTQKPPIKDKVGNTDEVDFYVASGDAVGYRYLCEWSADLVFNLSLEPLQSTKVWLIGGRVLDDFRKTKEFFRELNKLLEKYYE